MKTATNIFFRWTVRASCMRSVLDNYEELLQLWDLSLSRCSDTEMKARIIGIQSQMNNFHFLICKFLRVYDTMYFTPLEHLLPS